MQVDPIKPTLKPPGSKRLKVEHELLSNVAFNFNLRRYSEEVAARGVPRKRRQLMLPQGPTAAGGVEMRAPGHPSGGGGGFSGGGVNGGGGGGAGNSGGSGSPGSVNGGGGGGGGGGGCGGRLGSLGSLGNVNGAGGGGGGGGSGGGAPLSSFSHMQPGPPLHSVNPGGNGNAFNRQGRSFPGCMSERGRRFRVYREIPGFRPGPCLCSHFALCAEQFHSCTRKSCGDMITMTNSMLCSFHRLGPVIYPTESPQYGPPEQSRLDDSMKFR